MGHASWFFSSLLKQFPPVAREQGTGIDFAEDGNGLWYKAMSRRRPTPDELRVWARVARSVKPLTGRAALPETPGETEPPAQAATAQTRARPAVKPRAAGQAMTSTSHATPRTISGKPSGAPAYRGNERQVRRGRVDFEARFDLHGHTQASADRALKSFLAGQQRAGVRCVLIITGKGRSEESVLRRNFLHWLDTLQGRQLVSGWSEAHARHGGQGAFYVFLRRPAR